MSNNTHNYNIEKMLESDLVTDRAKEALERPQRVLYLGRSEDVIFTKKIYTQEDMEIDRKTANFIRLTYPTYIKRKIEGKEFPIGKEKFPAYFVGTKVIFKNGGKPVQNKAEITKETVRGAEFEAVIYVGAGSVIPLKDPIENLAIFKVQKGSKKLVFRIPEEFGWL